MREGGNESGDVCRSRFERTQSSGVAVAVMGKEEVPILSPLLRKRREYALFPDSIRGNDSRRLILWPSNGPALRLRRIMHYHRFLNGAALFLLKSYFSPAASVTFPVGLERVVFQNQLLVLVNESRS